MNERMNGARIRYRQPVLVFGSGNAFRLLYPVIDRLAIKSVSVTDTGRLTGFFENKFKHRS